MSTITISNEIKDSEEFLNWYKNNRTEKIKFKGKSEKTRKMKALYKFIKFHEETKEKCEINMNNYNSLLLNEENEFIKEAMENFTSSNRGGKYIRSSLCALGYKSFGKEDDKYIPLSTALEIFQTSILIHDDIIDNSKTRRGMDTIPVKYKKIYSSPIKTNKTYEKKLENLSNSLALCIGDMGFYLANQIMTKNYRDNKNLAKLLEYYNETAIKTCKGEMIDIALPFYEEFYGKENLENQIIEIYKLKTSWYSVVGPYVMGAILSGVDDEKIEKLEDALMNLGIAFQIKDDILGIYGDEKKLGKSVHSDCEEYKQTVLYSYAVNTKYKEELQKLYGKENLKPKEFKKIQDIFIDSGAKKYSEQLMDRLFKESFSLILSLDFIKEKYKEILIGFAEYLKVRCKWKRYYV